jgi:hypothetical protein
VYSFHSRKHPTSLKSLCLGRHKRGERNKRREHKEKKIIIGLKFIIISGFIRIGTIIIIIIIIILLLYGPNDIDYILVQRYCLRHHVPIDSWVLQAL